MSFYNQIKLDIEKKKKEKAELAFNRNLLSNAVENGTVQSAFNDPNTPLVTFPTDLEQERLDEHEAKYKELEDQLADPETLLSSEVLTGGKFRFNDIVLPISPEQISVIVDEYEDSLLLMRQEVPVIGQSGRKKIRIIVNFAYDTISGWTDLAKMAIQIRKTPIATIENEKIRKELFGELDDFSNIGVVVDNFSGYMEEDYPTLMRCTLQMSWFNHAPYVQDIKYVDETADGIKWTDVPTKTFVDFYRSGTGNLNLLVNDPTIMDRSKSDKSLTVMYKEYREFKDTLTKSRVGQGSFVAPIIESGDEGTVNAARELLNQGWYLGSEDEEDIKKVIDGVFYRWRKIEIPYTDLDTSGALILQNMSFSLSTNPSYISMESYAVPTIQFLGGSTSEIRGMVFAAAEYASYEQRTPIETSKDLSTLMSIFKKVSEDRLRYPKYAKENHLLISHPIAKLMKYRSHEANSSEFTYSNSKGELDIFNINDFLPVVLSSSQSTTVPGLPFASKLQLDFKETRLARNVKNITFNSRVGSGNIANQQDTKRKLILTVAQNTGIFFDSKTGNFAKSEKRRSTDREKADILLKALNALRFFDPSVLSVESAFNSKVFLSNGEREADLSGGLADPNESKRKLNLIGREYSGDERRRGIQELKKSIFSSQWVDQYLVGLYADFANGVIAGDDWVGTYVQLFDDFASIIPLGTRDTYPDMMLPAGRENPAFYFANNENRTNLIRNNILKNMSKRYGAYQENLGRMLLGKEIEKLKDEVTGQPLINLKQVQYGASSYSPAYNYAAIPSNEDKGRARTYNINDATQREIVTELAMAHATAPNDSLAKVYPAFSVQLYSDRFNVGQKYSANDLTAKNAASEQQLDLLDMYDLSSIMDIRIIKDEHEAADVMIIRILNTQKHLMTSQGKDPNYSAETYHLFGQGGLFQSIYNGSSVVNQSKTNNLEDIGLKEGTKIRAYLGNSTDAKALELEFTGRIAAINGKNIVEIYCIGDGHELIQDTKGYERDEVKIDSDTVDLIGEVLSKAEEVKSFGNTKFEIVKGIGLDLPDFMGGVSALDNITAPSMWPGFADETFGFDVVDNATRTFFTVGGVAFIFGTVLTGGALLGLAGLSAGIGLIGTTFSRIAKAYNPCQFTIYQQTIWDVLQELTLRHPGYICATVPFDNRSTIYFGEPDGLYFYRGYQTAMERSIKMIGATKGNRNTTVREIYDQRTKESIGLSIPESSHPFLLPTAKMQTDIKKMLSSSGAADVKQMALLNMQKPFRNYHLVTSENDIISNDIEASSTGVANSVQVYHPVNNDNGNPDGKEWFSNYKLTDKMKADDDLLSNYVNNKIFTFHNAHNEDDELELPQRYAKAILCKELGNIYKGKLSILGRKGIKPHDIVILNDTYNKISGPCAVGRVVHLISPQNGWTTHIYPKFIAIPDTSAGAFQMKAILKASRYWLGTTTELFYSNMEKFRPTEIADSNKFTDELFRATDQLVNGQEFDNDLSKEELENGEHNYFDELNAAKAVNALDSASAGIGNVALNKALGGSKQILKNNGRSIKEGARKFDRLTHVAQEAYKKKQWAKGTAKFGYGGAKTVAKVGGKLFARTALGFAGGFLFTSLLEGIADGFVSYMKYRQPVSIFPLTKEGKPWMAALNGFTENSAIEHMKLQSVRGADKFGFMVSTVRQLYEDWAGEVPADVGYGGEYRVVGVANDGDTLEIQNGSSVEKIRMSGYDSGEVKNYGNTKSGGSNELAMGLEAKKRVNELIQQNGGMVSIVRHAPDTYNRTIADLATNDKYKERVKVGSRDIHDILKEEGLVLSYPAPRPKSLYYEKFPGGSEEVWGKMYQDYKKKYPERIK